MRVKLGSPQHFRQVVNAHVVSIFGNCRCGARVGQSDAAYRAHIADVWQPHELPEDFIIGE